MPGPPPLQQMGVLPGTGAPMPSLSLAPSAIAQAPPQPPPPPQIQVKELHGFWKENEEVGFVVFLQ